ncbi:flagellar hook-length control protein FliK [Sphaerotilus sulfidivorans]|uniref:Flagellar hook-length control protein FliK n=1 Tax=Sphaerotilus sulfidivorans TaxID=639200 RepID=A0A5C1Q6E6_9BURK|nr:flagellar hook-length control protein FliK [Sphaerotilus sulfidivorans]NZD45835.1 flagellar hook-length control protein FliK [Sphaerotilus sulfidivorans]QEN01692.1 flagellar hook-length control protein FliK [Sphaerotilus sulfidivorans]
MDPSLLNLSPLPARAGRGGAPSGAASSAEGGSGAGTTFAGLLSSSMTGAATAPTAVPGDPEAADRSPLAAGEGGGTSLGGLSLSALLRLRMNAAAGRETASARATLADAGSGAEGLSADRLAALLASSGGEAGIETSGDVAAEPEPVADEADAPWRMEHGLLPPAPDLQLPMMPDPAVVPAPGSMPQPVSEMAPPQTTTVESADPVFSPVATSEPARLQRGAGAMPGATAVHEASMPGAAPVTDFSEALPPAGSAPERRVQDSAPVAEAARAAAAGAVAASEARPALAAWGEAAFSRQSGRSARTVDGPQTRGDRPILSSDRLSSEAALAADRALQASLRLQAAAQMGVSRASAGSAAETQAATAAVVAAGSPMPAVADLARATPKGSAASATDNRMPIGSSPGAGLEALRAGATAPNDRTELAARLEPAGSAEGWAGALAQAQATVPAQGAASAAPAVVAESRVETPFGHPDFADEMVAHVAQHASLSRHGLREVTLHLNPVEMGPVSVRIAIEGSVASVDFAATQAATRQQLEQSLPALAAALGEDGLSLGSSSVGETAPVASSGASSDSLAGGSGGSGGSGAFQEGRARDAGGQQAASRQGSGFVVDLPEGRARPADPVEPAPVRRSPTRAGGLDLFA